LARVWHYWPDTAARTGPANMAVDQALLELAGEEGLAVLRVYRWEPHTLSFGRNEPAKRRYDRDAIAREEIPTVRRPTGGRAVWHARELTYAVAAPTDRFGALPAAYQAIHRTIAQALGALGADARLAEAGGVAGLDAGACFASPVGGEVMVHGRKVVGSAQIRVGTGMLQHGSILLDDDQRRVAALTVGAPASGMEAPLNAVLARRVDAATVAESLAAAARGSWPGGWTELDPTVALERAARHLPFFSSEEWTWRR
jgi:lipoyl(octanoyl) transferase